MVELILVLVALYVLSVSTMFAADQLPIACTKSGVKNMATNGKNDP